MVGRTWKSNQFDKVKDNDSFRCFDFVSDEFCGKVDIPLRSKYTKQIFDFFDKHFPGVNIGEGHQVKLEELEKAFYKGYVFKNRPDENCHRQATMTNIQRTLKTLLEKHKLTTTTTDYYGARNITVGMLGFLGNEKENHMVEIIPGVGKSSFWGNFTKFDPIMFYVDYYNIMDRDDDGKLRMEEIREVYKDILAEYPSCGGFERNVDKFMAEVKRRYDANGNGYLTLEEGRELCFCFAAFLKDLPFRSHSPILDEPDFGQDVHAEVDSSD